MRQCISAINWANKNYNVVGSSETQHPHSQADSEQWQSGNKGEIGMSWKEDAVLKTRDELLSMPRTAICVFAIICFLLFFSLLLSDSLFSLCICSLCAALIQPWQLRTRRPFCWEHMFVSSRCAEPRWEDLTRRECAASNKTRIWSDTAAWERFS